MKKIYWHYPHLQFWMGGTKFLLEITSRLSKAYNVTIVCNTGDKDIIAKFQEQGITVITTSLISTNSIIYWGLLPLFIFLDYYRNKKYFYEADYLFATLFPSNVFCALFSKFEKRNYLYYCYEPFPFLQNNNFINRFPLTKRLLLRLLAFFYKNVDIWATQQAKKILTLNQITQKMIKKIYKKQAIVALMGVDGNQFKHYSTNKIATRYKKLILITHSTDYTSMKRTDLAIIIIAKLVKHYPNILLIITSTQPDSPEKKQYENLAKKLHIEKNILFLGLIPYKELPLYYSASLCYLSCSYDEMLGTTSSNLPVKEALACQTPCIRANITTEDVEDGKSGFLVDPRDTELVSKKIEYLIQNPEIAKKMGKVGRKKIIQLYNWNYVVSIIIKNLAH